MKSYNVLTPLRMEHGKVFPGSTVELSEKHAAELLAVGAISEVVMAPTTDAVAPKVSRKSNKEF